MYSTDEFRMIVNTINEQLNAVTPLRVLLSWGISKRSAITYNGMPTLALEVDGLLHKGWVYIAYDRGPDLYSIYALNAKGEPKRTIEGVYFEDLGNVLDGIIERDPSTTVSDYKKSVETFYRISA